MEVHASTVSIVASFTVRMLSEFKVGIVVRQVGELHRVVVIVLGIQIAPNDHAWLEFLDLYMTSSSVRLGGHHNSERGMTLIEQVCGKRRGAHNKGAPLSVHSARRDCAIL